MTKKSTPSTEATTTPAPEVTTTPAPEATTTEATTNPAPEVSAAASALGRRARGVPKTITPERLDQLREAAAHARGVRARNRALAQSPAQALAQSPAIAPANPHGGAPQPQPPTTGRRVGRVSVARPVPAKGIRAGVIVAPTKSEVDVFGAGR